MSADRAQDVADVIGALEDPTPLAVYHATRSWDPDVIASAAGSIAAQGGGGGGGSAAGSTGEIQYNDGDAFAASADFVWDDGAKKLLLVATENGHAVIEGNGVGTELQLVAAPGDETHTGGEVVIQSGASVGQNGGDVTVVAGSDGADGNGGSLSIQSGFSVDGDGGEIEIRANPAGNVGGDGGAITIVAGGGDGGGGDVLIQGGANDGNIQLYSGDSNQAVQLDNTGLRLLGPKIGFFGAAAVVQPTGVAVDAAAIHAALVSLGLITA